MNSLFIGFRNRWQTALEPESRPALVIGVFGLLISLCFIPAFFSRLFALVSLNNGPNVSLWLFAVVLFGLSLFIALNQSKWKEQIALIFFGLLLLVAAELTVRFVIVQVTPLQLLTQVVRHGLVTKQDQWRFRPHPFLQYVGNHNYFMNDDIYNLTGFPGREVSREKPANVIRIACLGGSTTEYGYPQKMEQYLNSQKGLNGIRFEVLNFGLSGYNSNHSTVNFVLNVVDYSPDYVVFHHAWNDKMSQEDENFRTHNFRSDYTHALKSFDPPILYDAPLIRSSIIYREVKHWVNPNDGWTHFSRAIQRQWPQNYLPPSQHPNIDNLETYWRNIETVIDVAQARDIYPVMTTQPHSTDPQIPRYEEGWFVDAANDTMRNGVSHEEEIIFVDLDQAITGNRNDLFWDLGHMHEEGKQLKAEMIGDAIYSHVLAEQSQAIQNLSSSEQQ